MLDRGTHNLCDAITQLMLLHTLMLRCDTTYVSTLLLLLSMRTRTTFGAYRMTSVASPHNCRCVPLNLCR
jgi:hypothetical protein